MRKWNIRFQQELTLVFVTDKKKSRVINSQTFCCETLVLSITPTGPVQFCDSKKQREKQHLHLDENKLLISLAHRLIYMNTIVSPSVVTTCIINKETRDCQSVTFFSPQIFLKTLYVNIQCVIHGIHLHTICTCACTRRLGSDNNNKNLFQKSGMQICLLHIFMSIVFSHMVFTYSFHLAPSSHSPLQ